VTAVAERKIPAAASWRAAKKAGRRLTWGLSDQAMCSLTNFLLSIYIARTLGAVQFGAFTLAYVTYGFAINASRGLSVEPLLIRFSGPEVTRWRRATAGCTGTALLVGIATGACAVIAGLVVGHTTGEAFLALGLTLPGLLLQDSWRYAFFALGRGYHAFVNDTFWAVIQIPLLVVLKVTGHADVFWFVLAWGLGGTAGAILGMFQAKVVPSLIRAKQWLIKHRDLGPRYLAENTGSNGADTVRSYSVSSILGLADVGYIQAANTLMGPFKVIFYGMSMLTIPEAARLLRESPRRLPLFCAAMGAGLGILALLWGVALLVALPLGIGHLMLGQIWRPTYPLVLPAALYVTAGCVGTGATIGLHALGAARRSLRAALITSGLIVVAGVSGALLGGVLGCMHAIAAVAWIGTFISWWELRKALHDHDGVQVPSWMFPRSSGRHQKPQSPQTYRRPHKVRR
jgi:O-antigen/teichoic acid export membrane protein